jgi:hypothetical protein
MNFFGLLGQKLSHSMALDQLTRKSKIAKNAALPRSDQAPDDATKHGLSRGQLRALALI